MSARSEATQEIACRCSALTCPKKMQTGLRWNVLSRVAQSVNGIITRTYTYGLQRITEDKGS
jgi:hypothetical protein